MHDSQPPTPMQYCASLGILIPCPGQSAPGNAPEMALFEYKDLAQLPPGPVFHILERLSTMSLCRALLLADKPARDLFASLMPASAIECAQILFVREAPYARQPEHFEAAAELMAILRQHALDQGSSFLEETDWHAQAERKILAASAQHGRLDHAFRRHRI